MNTFKLTVSSPDGHLFSGECEKFDARGSEGELAIMANHVPFITSVVKCNCTLHLPDGEKKTASTEGGLLTVAANEVTFVSGSFKFNN